LPLAIFFIFKLMHSRYKIVQLMYFIVHTNTTIRILLLQIPQLDCTGIFMQERFFILLYLYSLLFN